MLLAVLEPKSLKLALRLKRAVRYPSAAPATADPALIAAVAMVVQSVTVARSAR
jgi:hypothetical protein